MQDHPLNSNLTRYINSIEPEFINIPVERREILQDIADYVDARLTANQPANLIFICTHNSRRSHLSQLWAQAAAYYYGIPNVHCYSGGTEATAFNPRAVAAMVRAGFVIEKETGEENPVYRVSFAPEGKAIKAFSKRFDDPYNPQANFMAIMTCSDADEACPIVPGAEDRLSIPYEDPKKSDGTPEEAYTYEKRCRQIAREMFYVFDQLN